MSLILTGLSKERNSTTLFENLELGNVFVLDNLLYQLFEHRFEVFDEFVEEVIFKICSTSIKNTLAFENNELLKRFIDFIICYLNFPANSEEVTHILYMISSFTHNNTDFINKYININFLMSRIAEFLKGCKLEAHKYIVDIVTELVRTKSISSEDAIECLNNEYILHVINDVDDDEALIQLAMFFKCICESHINLSEHIDFVCIIFGLFVNRFDDIPINAQSYLLDSVFHLFCLVPVESLPKLRPNIVDKLWSIAGSNSNSNYEAIKMIIILLYHEGYKIKIDFQVIHSLLHSTNNDIIILTLNLLLTILSKGLIDTYLASEPLINRLMVLCSGPRVVEIEACDVLISIFSISEIHTQLYLIKSGFFNMLFKSLSSEMEDEKVLMQVETFFNFYVNLDNTTKATIAPFLKECDSLDVFIGIIDKTSNDDLAGAVSKCINSVCY